MQDDNEVSEEEEEEEEEEGDASLCDILWSHCREYCESTSIHGFAYWVAAPRLLEKLFWVCLVATFGTFAALIIRQRICK